jgi:hypothetical protein
MVLFQKDMKKMSLRFNVKLMLSVKGPLSKFGEENLRVKVGVGYGCFGLGYELSNSDQTRILPQLNQVLFNPGSEHENRMIMFTSEEVGIKKFDLTARAAVVGGVWCFSVL